MRKVRLLFGTAEIERFLSSMTQGLLVAEGREKVQEETQNHPGLPETRQNQRSDLPSPDWNPQGMRSSS